MLHGLVDQNIAVSQEQYFFLTAGFPKAMDDLECRVGFARTRCHNKQNAVLPAGNCVNSTVDGDTLIVARCFITWLKIVWLGNQRFLVRCH